MMKSHHPFLRLKQALTKSRPTSGEVKEQPPIFFRIYGQQVRRYDPQVAQVPAADDPSAYTVAFYPHATASQVRQLAEAGNLQGRLVHELMNPLQAKYGQFGDVIYLPLRGAQYIDATGDVRLIPVQVLLKGAEVVVLLPEGVWFDGKPVVDSSSEASLAELDRRIAENQILQETAGHGPPGLTYWLIEEVIASFVPALEGLEEDQEQVEIEVFTGRSRPSQKIYKLNQEAAELLRASNAIERWLPSLIDDLYELYPTLREDSNFFFGDLGQHVQSLSSQVTLLREALSQVLTVNATLVAEKQNDDMKKISGWAGIAFAPTLVAGIYGMNFIGMPELDWAHGYPVAIGVMITLSTTLYFIFKRNDWI